MRVDCALLCDAVTVRDGLLHILGGGVTRLARPQFPGPLGVSMAVRVMVHPTETKDPHVLKCVLLDADGTQVMGVQAQFEIGSVGDLEAGEEFSCPMPLPLSNAPLPAPGNYSFEILIDGIHQVSVPFAAVLVEQPLPLPGGNDDA